MATRWCYHKQCVLALHIGRMPWPISDNGQCSVTRGSEALKGWGPKFRGNSQYGIFTVWKPGLPSARTKGLVQPGHKGPITSISRLLLSIITPLAVWQRIVIVAEQSELDNTDESRLDNQDRLNWQKSLYRWTGKREKNGHKLLQLNQYNYYARNHLLTCWDFWPF